MNFYSSVATVSYFVQKKENGKKEKSEIICGIEKKKQDGCVSGVRFVYCPAVKDIRTILIMVFDKRNCDHIMAQPHLRQFCR